MKMLASSSEERLIPSPVLVEVDYLLRTHIGPTAFLRLLEDIREGAFVIVDLEYSDYVRTEQIISRYSDSDIGFVDAAVLAIVERLDEPKLATLDRRHFSMMRPRHVDALQLVPDL